MTDILLKKGPMAHGGKLPKRDDARNIDVEEIQAGDDFAAPKVPLEYSYSGDITSWGMMLNDRIGDCVTPETRVLTESLEWVRAGSLQVGDRLLGFDEDSQVRGGRVSGRWFCEAVVEKADIVTRPCYELEFEDGTVVRSSAGHQWLTRSTVQGELGCQRWARTEDLTVGPLRQTRVVKPLDVWSDDTSWHAGYLAAAFDGEGHLEQVSRANRVAFNQTANSMLDQVELSLKELGFDYHHETHNRNKLLRADGSPRKEMHTLRIGNRRDFLRFMGSVRPRRLLAAYDVASLGRIPGETVALVRKTFIGDQRVVMLDTSSRTYFAEGLASHNCTIATAGHEIMMWTADAGGPEITPSDADILAAYSAVSGYNPATGANDTGAVELDVLNYWRQTGIAGHQIGAYAELKNFRNHWLVRKTTYQFEGLYIGVQLPKCVEGASTWRVPYYGPWGDGEPGSWGGHAVPVVGYDKRGLWVVTWGELLLMTWAFWSVYVDEAYAIVSKDQLNSNGVSPLGVDYATMLQKLTAVTTAAA